MISGRILNNLPLGVLLSTDDLLGVVRENLDKNFNHGDSQRLAIRMIKEGEFVPDLSGMNGRVLRRVKRLPPISNRIEEL